LPCCRWALKAQRPLPSAYPKEIKTLGDHIRKRRLDLGLFQKDVARQIGVTEESVYNWETNRTEPEVRLIPRIIEFLGYTPYDATWSFGQRLRAIRTALGLSQEHMAKRAGLDEGTVAKWETGKHRPTKTKLLALAAFLRREK
jgi:transcriptional regulator with XRE-family HTH domain